MLRKFDMNTLQICPAHRSDVVTLAWEIRKKSFFNIIIHILQIIYVSSDVVTLAWEIRKKVIFRHYYSYTSDYLR